ncbi:MAG: dual specificity protein phosphatase family protein [Acidobacteriota bacterium]
MPTPDSYWVKQGELMAGEYPGAFYEDLAVLKIGRFLDLGITCFVDLTEEGEYGLRPYAPALESEGASRGLGVRHSRLPIADMTAPSVPSMRRILATIEKALADGDVVYVHCFGGIGRTGTVVGCYLVEHGMSGEEALREIDRLRDGTPDGNRRSPETDAQRGMVLGWQRALRTGENKEQRSSR